MKITIELPDLEGIDLDLVKEYAVEHALIQARENRLKEITELDEKIIEIEAIRKGENAKNKSTR